MKYQVNLWPVCARALRRHFRARQKNPTTFIFFPSNHLEVLQTGCQIRK